MNKRIYIFFALFVIASTTIHAQVYNWADGEDPYHADSIGGLYVGLNLGFYKAHNSTASMYGGYGFDREGARLPFSSSWLNQAIKGSFPAVQRTNEALGGVTESEWSFDESDMPGVMRYNATFMWGGHLRYMFNADFGVFAEINGSNPVTVGEFTIRTLGSSNVPGQQNPLRRFQIRGEEQRMIINLGVHRVIGRGARERSGKSTTLLPYIDFGVNTTFVKFEENLISLGELVQPVDLTEFFNQQGFFIDEARILTGVGLGAFGGAGGQIQLGSKFTIDIGYVASFEQIKLGEMNERNFQHIFVLKAIYLTF